MIKWADDVESSARVVADHRVTTKSVSCKIHNKSWLSIQSIASTWEYWSNKAFISWLSVPRIILNSASIEPIVCESSSKMARDPCDIWWNLIMFIPNWIKNLPYYQSIHSRKIFGCIIVSQQDNVSNFSKKSICLSRNSIRLMYRKLHSEDFSSKRKWYRTWSTLTHDKVVSLFLQERKLMYSPKEQREKRKNVANFCSKRCIPESLDRSNDCRYMVWSCHLLFEWIRSSNIDIFFVR